VSWRPAAGVAFPTEGTSETVTFLTHIMCGFGVPTGDLFRGLLYFYWTDLVHLVPNAITIVSYFIHLCEAYWGKPPHVHCGGISSRRRRQGSPMFFAASSSCYAGI
jgi:hypothetical protein